MTDWAGMMPEEIKEKLVGIGESGFRGGQIFKWLSRGVGFADMTDLPKSLRERLGEGWRYPARIAREEISADGETEKYLFELTDGEIVEGVLLRYHHGNTLCLSTQVGCRMGCAFCASTLQGRIRDLRAAEMYGMLALVNARYAQGERRGATNIVLMGSGEPLDNYDEVLRFIRLCMREEGLNISPRNISLSTCGLVEGIDRLAQEGLALTLSLSLHAPNDRIRRQVMPVAARYSIEETVAALRRYTEATGRRAIVEYTLIGGLNDREEHAAELAALLRGINLHVNLIPLNPVDERPNLRPPLAQDIRAFQGALQKGGLGCTLRRALGEDIQGACGQLRRRHMEDVDR